MTRSPTRIFEFGDVVLVKYSGVRPGVVVSTKNHNATALDIVLMMITTKKQHAMRGGAIVLDNWKQFGLDEPSIVKPIFFSYAPDDLTPIGRVDDEVKTQLRQSIAKIFGGTVRR